MSYLLLSVTFQNSEDLYIQWGKVTFYSLGWAQKHSYLFSHTEKNL